MSTTEQNTEAKTYIIKYEYRNASGEIGKDKAEWTLKVNNCLEAMELFIKDAEEKCGIEIININVKPKKQANVNPSCTQQAEADASVSASPAAMQLRKGVKSMDNRYNGWTNYETWVTKLWMDNSEGEYHYWRERVAEIAEQTDYDFMEAAYNLSQEIKDAYEEAIPEVSGVWSDLLRSAFEAVNWYEIAESLLNE